MEIKYLRLIKTIAEEGNIANSSEKLYLTQSALSHQLKTIEETLGFKIFYRSRNNWTLTEEGKELYELATEVLNVINTGLRKIDKIKNDSTGLIRLSTECSTFYQGLPFFIQKMGRLYPNINIEFNEATSKPFDELKNNEIDVAIVTKESTEGDFVSMKYYEDDVLALMNEEHLLAGKDFIDASDFVHEHLIIQSYPLSTVSVYEHFLKPNEVEPAKVTSGIQTELCLEMIAANMGIMCVPKWTLSRFKIPENLIFKKIGSNGLKRNHFLVFRKADQNKKFMNEFIINFQEEFSSKHLSHE